MRKHGACAHARAVALFGALGNNPLQQRMAVLAGLKAVDWVVAFSEDTPERIISQILPNVLVKGGDYKPDEIAGAACVKSYGGKIEILGFVEGCSTSVVIQRIIGETA